MPPEQGPSEAGSRSRAGHIVRDPQFWIPVLVLVAGLLVLRWIR